MKKISLLCAFVFINQILISSQDGETQKLKNSMIAKVRSGSQEDCITEYISLLSEIENAQQQQQSALQSKETALEQCKADLEKYKGKSGRDASDEKNRKLTQNFNECLLNQDKADQEFKDALAKQKADFEKEHIDLKTTLEKANQKIAKLEKENQIYAEQYPTCQTDRDQALKQVDNLSKTIKKQNTNIDDLMADKESLLQAVKEREQAVKNQREDANAKIKDLESQIKSLTTLKDMNTAIPQESAKVREKLEAELATQKENAKKLQAEIDQLKADLKQPTHKDLESQTSSELQKALENARNEAEAVQLEHQRIVTALQKENAELKKEISDKDRRALSSLESEISQAKIAENKLYIDEIKKEMPSLLQQLNDLKKLIAHK